MKIILSFIISKSMLKKIKILEKLKLLKEINYM